MKASSCIWVVLFGLVFLSGRNETGAQDWPQWRGINRDARADGFNVPATWPEDLTKKWSVSVGEGVSTPALVGDKLFVFARQSDTEILRCLNAETGEPVWQNEYATEGATGAAARFSGPRSSPTVAEGKVVTLGVRGILSCVDAATGETIWRKDDFSGQWPRFFTSSSPMVLDGVCIAQLGGQEDGVIVAYDLTTGDEKWRSPGEGTAYASPVLLAAEGSQSIIAQTDKSIVSIDLSDGSILWQTPFEAPRRGYNAATPIVDGSMVIYSGSGRGTKAVQLEKQEGEWKAKELWSNETSVQFNSPILKDGLVYGISDGDALFCLNAQNGETVWTTSLARGRGYGSVVDAGSVLVALTPSSELLVFEPSNQEYKELARYKVSDSDTYAYPVLAGSRIYVKDQDSVALWTVE